MNKQLSEDQIIKSAFDPQDVNGGQAGSRIDMSQGNKLAIVIACDGAASDLTIDLLQHDAPSAGNSKALSADSSYYHKVGAAVIFSKVDFSASQIIDANVNGSSGVIVIEVEPQDLDVAGGFGYISVDVSAAAIKVASAVYHILDPRKKPAYSEEA